MKEHNENCPVCNCQINDSSIAFCPDCNWELMLIPDSASQGLKNYYKEKLKLHKATFNDISKLNQSIDELEKKIEKIEKQKTELETKNKSLNSEIANQKSQFDKARNLEATVTENEKKIKQLSDNLEKEKAKLKKEQAAHEATKTKSAAYKFNSK